DRPRRNRRTLGRAVLPWAVGRDRRTRHARVPRRRRARSRAPRSRRGCSGDLWRPRAPILGDGARRAAVGVPADGGGAADRARARGTARLRPRRVRLRRARVPRGLDGPDAVMAVTAWDELPVVVTVAPTGAEVTRADNPALPHSPAEIAADAIASAEAGAAVCLLHVRADDGTPSSLRELFAVAIERIC